MCSCSPDFEQSACLIPRLTLHRETCHELLLSYQSSDGSCIGGSGRTRSNLEQLCPEDLPRGHTTSLQRNRHCDLSLRRPALTIDVGCLTSALLQLKQSTPLRHFLHRVLSRHLNGSRGVKSSPWFTTADPNASILQLTTKDLQHEDWLSTHRSIDYLNLGLIQP